MLSSSESRRRKKDPDRERSSPKSKDRDRDKDKEREERKERHKSSKTSKTSRKTSSSTSKDGDRDPSKDRPSKERSRTSSSSHTPKAHRMTVVPELERRGSLGSPNGSRSSLSYPTLSKTHAKENIYAAEANMPRGKSPFTPEPTDVGDQSQVTGKDIPSAPARAPPSPPLTATTAADLRKTASANSMRHRNSEALLKEMEEGRRSVDSGTRLTPEPHSRAAGSSIRGGGGDEVEGTDITSTIGGGGASRTSTVRHRDRDKPSQVREDRVPLRLRPESNAVPTTKQAGRVSPAVRVCSRPASEMTQSTDSTAGPARVPGRPSPSPRAPSRPASEVTESTDSDATSVAPVRQAPRKQHAQSPINTESSPASVVDSSPRTPTQHSVLPSVVSVKDLPPQVQIVTDPTSRVHSVEPSYSAFSPAPPPPPPPPPSLVDPPRVDYLLQNGGLPQPVPRSLLAAIDPTPVMSHTQYASPRMDSEQARDVRVLFQPIQKLLDSYNSVIDIHGSLAVATGYRSVARRLLDRLEAVFARNISSEQCMCIMCLPKSIDPELADVNGVNWGTILELVSGRCDLPSWPPLNQPSNNGLGIDLEAPFQEIDVDVPEEYRAHYAHQSRKTKVAVTSWLSEQQDTAPEEADDETLTFAMLTHLPQADRPLYYALLYDMEELPTPRSQPQPAGPAPLFITKAALALQRLYRLHQVPRDQLVVMYLIRNPDMHSILATLSAVSKQEWEILISGRFDGFLWSGAEDVPPVASPSAHGPSRGPSRGPSNTPGMPRRFASPVVNNTYAHQTTPSASDSTQYTTSSLSASRPGSTRPTGPAPVQMDEDTEIAVLAEVEREIFSAMEAMEDAFEHLHNSAEVVRRRLRERGAALSMVAQARRGPSLGGPEVRMDTPSSFRGPDVDGSLEDLRSEIGPDDSASNVSYNRRGRGHRSRARRTPAAVEEESEVEGESLAERIRRRF